MNDIEFYNEKIFEQIKHVDEYNNEYWLARELMIVLEYKEWRKFSNVINKTIISCEINKIDVDYHFVSVDKTINMPKGASKIIEDYKLSRYACYLIVQNADSRKKAVALGQTYFAIQTRKQEILEEEIKEQEIRSLRRKELMNSNKLLNSTATRAGVKNYGKFINYGYQGLYNGETVDDIRKRKKLTPKDNISDYMSSVELGANIFRTTQIEDKIKRENIKGEENASKAHYIVGKEVRSTIKRLGGVMPEKLETPKKIENKLDKNTNVKKCK